MGTTTTTDDERIGQYVRQLRRARSLTLTQLAALADLSQPFLSQLERGQARPSMASLGRIARALGSSHLEIVSGAASLPAEGTGPAPSIVRADEGDRGRYGLGTARLLVSGDRPFYPMLFEGDNVDPSGYHSHPEHEFVHVLAGHFRADLGEDGSHDLAVGDSLYYVGGTPHRWYSPDGSPYRLFVVKQHLTVSGPTSGSAPELAPHDLTAERQES